MGYPLRRAGRRARGPQACEPQLRHVRDGIVCPDCGLAYCKETCEWGDNFAPPCEYEGWVQK